MAVGKALSWIMELNFQEEAQDPSLGWRCGGLR
uniref:Uncharacterized protein n=1 Tax=Anguilla anguilla TaxID=7936 RepID=A0A0E9SY33_ANGAN